MNTLLAAIGVFAVTNIDDILILSTMFADKKLKPRMIVLGQFLGIGAITLGAIIASIAVASFSTSWVALLGLLPVAIGLHKAYVLWQERNNESDDDVPASPSHGSQLIFVTTLTIANGGDNVGVYVPIFSTATESIPVYGLVFAMMTSVWCWLGHKLVNGSPVSGLIERYGKYVLPPALILIGLHISVGALDLFL